MFTQADLQAAEQLRRALQLLAGALPEEQAMEVATIYPQYKPGQRYTAGQYIASGTDANGDPLLYKVVQDHTSQEDWPPELTPALYTCVSLTEDDWPIWSQPTGAHDAYNTGDIVSFEGRLYRSKVDGNTWSPTAYPDGWELYQPV